MLSGLLFAFNSFFPPDSAKPVYDEFCCLLMRHFYSELTRAKLLSFLPCFCPCCHLLGYLWTTLSKKSEVFAEPVLCCLNVTYVLSPIPDWDK